MEYEEVEENYKPVRQNTFLSNSYIEYESKSEEYLNNVRPYLKNIINNLKKSDRWKIQLEIENNLISSIDNDEKHVMHSKSDNIEIMISDEADKL